MTNVEKIEKIRQTEIDKLFSSLNSTQDFRLRMGIFLGTVNLAAVGTAISYNKPIIIIIASLLMPIFIVADYSLLKNIYSYYYRGKRILSDEGYDSLNFFDMFIQIYNSQVRNSLAEIIGIEDENLALRRIRTLPYTKPTMIGFYTPVFAFVSEMLYGIISLTS